MMESCTECRTFVGRKDAKIFKKVQIGPWSRSLFIIEINKQ